MKKLQTMPYAQAATYTTQDGTKVLVSYKTRVACITPDGKPHCSMLYSATTRRHISAFAKENGLSFYDFKAVCNTEELPACLDNYARNPVTYSYVEWWD